MERTNRRHKKLAVLNPCDYLESDPPGVIKQWINSIQGYGIVAERDFAKDEFIFNYRGIHSSEEPLYDNPYLYEYEFKKSRYFIDASDQTHGYARFVNDIDAITKERNVKSVVVAVDNINGSTLAYVAARDIPTGNIFLLLHW